MSLHVRVERKQQIWGQAGAPLLLCNVMLNQPPPDLQRSQLNVFFFLHLLPSSLFCSKLYTTQQQDHCHLMHHTALCGVRGSSFASVITCRSDNTQHLKIKHGYCTVCGCCCTPFLPFFRHCVICHSHVSTGCLCKALVSASFVLPAGPMARWVSGCVVGAWRAPSVHCEGPLMGLNPQRPDL